MYIINGICYAGKADNTSEITDVKVIDDMMLLLTFSGGEKRLFDANILSGPVFKALKDPSVFRTAKIESGVVTWLNGDIDCAPEYMYNHSFHYDEIAV